MQRTLNSVSIKLIIFSDIFDSRQLKGDISFFNLRFSHCDRKSIYWASYRFVFLAYRDRKSTRIDQSNLLNN